MVMQVTKSLPNVPQTLLQAKRRIPNISFMQCIPNNLFIETDMKLRKFKISKPAVLNTIFYASFLKVNKN
jgi:hypothetical protein